METCEVLIIGGGPAGSSCARRLQDAGLDVIVMDKYNFPRDKVCAGWITPAVVEELDLDLDQYRQGRVCQEIKGFRTSALGFPNTYNDYNRTVSFGIRRFEFDHYLLSRSGARLVLNQPVNSILRHKQYWIINEKFQARMLIGAGGHFCPVARYLGANIGKSECAVSAQEIEFEMTPAQQSSCDINAEVPELFFYPDLSGYGWVFRKHQFINIGIGREGKGKISSETAHFLDFLQRQGKVPNDITNAFKGHAYLLYNHAKRKLLDDGVLLIGDAAGLAYSESGEGIRPAIESGFMAADVIIKAREDYRQENIEAYSHMITSRYGKKQNQQKKWIPKQLKSVVAKKILANRTLSRHIMLDRYFLRSGADSL